MSSGGKREDGALSDPRGECWNPPARQSPGRWSGEHTCTYPQSPSSWSLGPQEPFRAPGSSSACSRVSRSGSGELIRLPSPAPQHPASRLTAWYPGSSKSQVEERDLKTDPTLSTEACLCHLIDKALQLCCRLALLSSLVLFFSLCPPVCETKGRVPLSQKRPEGVCLTVGWLGHRLVLFLAV